MSAADQRDTTGKAIVPAGGGDPIGAAKLSGLAAASLRAMAHGSVRSTTRMARETVEIIAGTSKIAPERQDWRFKDATWSDNPAYKRLMQLYLAWSDEVQHVVDAADLDWRDAERARFVATVLTSALAPTNALVGNPGAMKRFLETGGASVGKGLVNFVGDMLNNGGMPKSVDTTPFTIGENVAATPGAVVYRDEVCELIQYAPTTPHVRARPVILVPPQINKYYFMDLAPGRSFVEHAVAHGLTFFVMSWRNPQSEHRAWNLDTYAGAILNAIDAAREITRSDDVNLISLCAGGITSTTVLNHLAAEGDERVRSASFGVTLLDFDVPAPIGMFDSAPVVALSRLRSRSSGVLDGATLGSVFTWLRPNDLVWNYWVNNYLLGKEPPSFDILAWNADSTNLPRALHGQFLDVFTKNVLATPGKLEVLGTPIDLGRITVDTYVTGATTDHLTPWRGCYRTTQLLNGDSTFILSNAGHIASLINPPGNPKSHYFAGPEPGGPPDEWLAGAQQEQGTWWTHWVKWVLERSGEERKPAARLGSRRHPALEDAPGSYVRGRVPAAA